jgi:integrase
MPKYKKRADGRYQANICIEVEKETGKRIFKTIYARTINDLENEKADIKDKLNKGIYADDKGMMVGTWAAKWFETEKATCGIRTKEMYELIVYNHIIPSIGDIKLRDLTKSDIQLMINKNSEHYRTCEQIRMATKQMLEGAIDDGLIYKNVGLKIKLPPKYQKEKRALTNTEKKAISKVNFTDKEKAYVYIILYCGLRRGEVLALSRNDVDLKANVINLRNAVTYDHGKAVLKTYPKSFSGIRTIPIPNNLKEVLEPYMKCLKGIYLFEMERKDGLMSKSSYDKFWNNIYKKINEKAGGNENINVISGLSAHVFRHNYATMLYYNDIDIKEAQRLLGHSNIKLTLDIYTHLDKDKSSADEKLSKLSAF